MKHEPEFLKRLADDLNRASGHVAATEALCGHPTEQVLHNVELVLLVRDILLKVARDQQGIDAVTDSEAPLCQSCGRREQEMVRGKPKEKCVQGRNMQDAALKRSCPGYLPVITKKE
jgi:hypothetical protein